MSSMIMFTCPTTGHDVRSGVLTDERTFSQLPRHGMVVQCNGCGGECRWCVAEGKLRQVEEIMAGAGAPTVLKIGGCYAPCSSPRAKRRGRFK